MSGLGELLLGKVNENSPKSNSGNIRRKNNNNTTESDNSNKKYRHDESSTSPRDSRDGKSQYRANQSQRTFPDRIEKGNREDDNQSNASSTDDYVRELLDPNDRPRNVWHVVEGPKKSPREDAPQRSHLSRKAEPIYDENLEIDSKNEANVEISPENPNPNFYTESEYDAGKQSAHSKDLEGESDLVRYKSRDKSSPSRHHSSRYSDHRHGSKDSRSHRDSDRHRSSSGRSRSNRKRDCSDDEDDHSRRRRSRGARHSKRRSPSRSNSRSRSRSRSRLRSRSPRSPSRRRDSSRSNSPQRNSRTIIVMQLNQRVVTRDLEDYFGDNVGNVREVRLIMDSRTRRHKGVAYIEFDDSRSASKALSLNGRKLHGAPLQIQPVNSRSSEFHSSASQQHSTSSLRSNHYSSSSTHPSSRSLPPNAYRVYIGALHTGITDEMLRTIVEPFGPVLRVEVIKDRTTGISRGYAFVTYANTEDGQEAVRCLDGFELADNTIERIIITKMISKDYQVQRIFRAPD